MRLVSIATWRRAIRNDRMVRLSTRLGQLASLDRVLMAHLCGSFSSVSVEPCRAGYRLSDRRSSSGRDWRRGQSLDRSDTAGNPEGPMVVFPRANPHRPSRPCISQPVRLLSDPLQFVSLPVSYADAIFRGRQPRSSSTPSAIRWHLCDRCPRARACSFPEPRKSHPSLGLDPFDIRTVHDEVRTEGRYRGDPSRLRGRSEEVSHLGLQAYSTRQASAETAELFLSGRNHSGSGEIA